MVDCDHCGRTLLVGEESTEGVDGTYCSRTCRYDAEVFERDDLPTRRDR